MRKTVFILLSLWLVLPSLADTYIVDQNGFKDFTTIQDAINAANNGDIIIVQPGIYTGNGNRDIDFFGKANASN